MGYANFEITFLDIRYVILFVFGICLIAIPFDTFLTNLTVKIVKRVLREKNERIDCKCEIARRTKWFTGIYSFWRLLLPDFLVAGPLLAWMFKIQMSPKHILRLNIIIQLIRS